MRVATVGSLTTDAMRVLAGAEVQTEAPLQGTFMAVTILRSSWWVMPWDIAWATRKVGVTQCVRGLYGCPSSVWSGCPGRKRRRLGSRRPALASLSSHRGRCPALGWPWSRVGWRCPWVGGGVCPRLDRNPAVEQRLDEHTAKSKGDDRRDRICRSPRGAPFPAPSWLASSPDSRMSESESLPRSV